MSVFTNPADGAPEAAAAYISALLEKLGDRDPISVLGSLMPTLKELTAGQADTRLRQPERAGKWSVIQVVEHLKDSELIWGYRLRMVLAHEKPVLTGYDQDLWADRLHYAEAKLERSLETLGVLRSGHLDLVGALSVEELERCGVHQERGEESVAHMLRLYAGHDLVHTDQIRRILSIVP